MFKVGDVVKIRQDSQYFGLNDANPGNVAGVIFSRANSDRFNIRVEWENGQINTYNDSDLEFFYEQNLDNMVTEQDAYKYLTDSKIKLSKLQMYRFKQCIEMDSFPMTKEEFKLSTVSRYIETFKGKGHSINRYLRMRKLNHIELIDKLQPYKKTFEKRFNLNNDHVPFLKNVRYFGIEMECLVHSENSCGECSECYGSGEESVSCYDCSGEGHISVDCETCEGSGRTEDSEGILHECRDCEGSGSISESCDSCDDGLISVECSYCEGSGESHDEESSAVSEVIEVLEDLKIPYLTVTEDGSIESEGYHVGVEIKLMVSMDTLDNIDKVTKVLKEKMDARVNNSCGLHVHLDARHINNRHNQEEYKKVAHRLEKAMRLLRYTVPEHRRGDKAYNKAGMSFNDRYREINACNEDTIEIRNHEATLDANEIKNWIKLMNACFNCEALDLLDDEYDTAAERCIKTLDALKLKPKLKNYVLNRIKENSKSYAERIVKNLQTLKLTNGLKKKTKTIEYRLGA